MTPTTAPRLVSLGAVVAAAALGACARATPWPFVTSAYDQTYYSARDNWLFRARYPDADRLFNAFDYGHAILYETLLSHPADAASRLEGPVFTRITTRVLRHPPSIPLEEKAVGPDYVNLVPEVAEMFAWAHVLHRQLYDAIADERLDEPARDARVAKLIAYYRSRADLAFSASPKSMELMEGQPYSLAFRRQDPRFNGLIWSYHWLQMVLYDALLDGSTPAARHANVDAAVARFWTMIDSAPGAGSTPLMMPMSPAIAPTFATRYPEAAIIFDNLHSLHDVVSDILTSPVVPRSEKRAVILRAAAQYRDSVTQITTVDAWRDIAREMGAEHMGGRRP